MPRSGLAGRLDRVASAHAHVDVLRLARRLAAVEGISDVELLAEATHIARVCQQQGITSLAGMVDFWATELGIAPGELEREVARVREQMA
jgi:hypothetical protein